MALIADRLNYYILLLEDKFNLSFPETAAVQTTMEFIPNTALFFVAACLAHGVCLYNMIATLSGVQVGVWTLP